MSSTRIGVVVVDRAVVVLRWRCCYVTVSIYSSSSISTLHVVCPSRTTISGGSKKFYRKRRTIYLLSTAVLVVQVVCCRRCYYCCCCCLMQVPALVSSKHVQLFFSQSRRVEEDQSTKHCLGSATTAAAVPISQENVRPDMPINFHTRPPHYTQRSATYDVVRTYIRTQYVIHPFRKVLPVTTHDIDNVIICIFSPSPPPFCKKNDDVVMRSSLLLLLLLWEPPASHHQHQKHYQSSLRCLMDESTDRSATARPLPQSST